MKRGEVYLASLDPVQGSEQAGTRPVVILQADAVTRIIRTVTVVPFTSSLRWDRFPFCARVDAPEGGLTSDSVALCHQIRVMDRTRLIRRLGSLDEESVVEIERSVAVTLGMERLLEDDGTIRTKV